MFPFSSSPFLHLAVTTAPFLDTYQAFKKTPLGVVSICSLALNLSAISHFFQPPIRPSCLH